MPTHVTEVPCHSITGPRQFYNYVCSVTYYLIIGAFLATLCVHDILHFMFMFTFQFVFISHILFMLHEHSYTYCISYIFSCYYYIWNFIYLYSIMPMYSHIIHVFLSLYVSILFRNWNHSNWIIQLKLWHLRTKLVNLPISLGTVCNTHFSGVLTSYLTLVLVTILNLRC